MRVGRVIATVVRGSNLAVSIAAVLPSAYLATLTALAARRPAPGAAPAGSGGRRFAVLVPAHDEASVIAASMRSYHELDHPRDRFAVHVVADNCTDDTAELVRAAGWTAHERHDAERPGKGHALNWLHDRLVADPERWGTFDAFVIVDADTEVDAGLLTAFDRAFADGAVAAQGYYAVADPDTSPTVGLRYAAIACRHHLRPSGRAALGGSCGLYGNGMAFAADILATRRWSGHLVEDAEFQLELLLDGVLVTYVPDAVVRAEMPVTAAAATTQNERWELGRLQLAKRFTGRLATRAVDGRPPGRAAAADAVADQLVPPLSALVAIDVCALASATLTAAVGRRRSDRAVAAMDALALAAVVAHVLVALRLVRAPASVYRSLRRAPQMVLWKLRLLSRVSRRPDSVTWTRTTRNDTGEDT